MRNIIVARRYAKALLDVATEDGMLQKVESDLRTLSSVIAENAEYSKFMLNAMVPKKIKLLFFNTALASVKLHTTVTNFLYLLVHNNRISLIHSICEQFWNLLDKQNNIQLVKIKTASPLSSAMFDDLQKDLKVYLQSDIKIQNIVDPAIIGGMILKIDSKLLDGSIAAKLAKIRRIAEV